MDTSAVTYLQNVHYIEPSSDVASLVQYDTNPTRYRCRKCDSIFTRVIDWALHNFTNHMQPKYMCTHCDFRYVYDIKDLVCHMLSAHAFNSFCCYICEKLFYNHDVFLLHMRDYHVSQFFNGSHVQNFYTCRKCTQWRPINNIEELLNHHTNEHCERIMFCWICGKILNRYMKYHLNNHFISKSRECRQENCNVKCFTLINLRKHVRAKHPTILHCERCFVIRVFYHSQEDLQCHIREQHANQLELS